jgi:hypothetical protein
MFGWPSINFTAASSSSITDPHDSGEDGDVLPDYYRFLDPLYSNRKFKPLDDFAPESYLDDEGHVYHSTYRLFPTLIPPSKRSPPEERPAYFQSFWDRVPEPEFRIPSQSLTTNAIRQAREEVPHERTGLLSFTRLRGCLKNDGMNDDGVSLAYFKLRGSVYFR